MDALREAVAWAFFDYLDGSVNKKSLVDSLDVYLAVELGRKPTRVETEYATRLLNNLLEVFDREDERGIK